MGKNYPDFEKLDILTIRKGKISSLVFKKEFKNQFPPSHG
jgi:hypothetical protein